MSINLHSYGQGVPVLFFHGWGFDSQIWLPLVPLLDKNYQLILVDLPGFGKTSAMDWDVFKRSLLWQLPEQCAVVGWSLGGLYATRLALEEPSRVSSLVNVTSSPRFVGDTLWPGIIPEVFAHFYKNLTINVQETLNDFIRLQLGKSKTPFSLGVLPSIAGLDAGLSVLSSWDFREEIKRLTQPACFMFGRLDPITPVKIMRVMQELYPDFQYVLFERAAHMPFLSHRDLFVDELLRFIQ